MEKIYNYIKLIRVKHWVKNLLVFVPLMFSSQILDKNMFLLTFIGCISFCFASSAIYIFNDIKDVEKDRKHKVKKNRPIAAGKILIPEAIVLMVILVTLVLLLNIFILKNIYALLLVLLYLLLNIGYSSGLKNVPILDIIILVSGFVLRVIYGASIASIEISKWLYITIMSFAFFMGFGKRRNEIIKQGDSSREVLKYYTREYLDKFMYVCLILTLIFYSLWSIDTTTIERFGNDYMIYTIPLLLVIFMKYCLNLENNDSFGDPVDVLFSDKVLVGLVLLFVIAMFALVYIV